MPKSNCLICMTEIKTYPSYPRQFCSSLCYGKSKEKKVAINCLWCDKVREVKKSIIDLGQGKFCSTDCAYAHRRTVVGNRKGIFTKHLTRPKKNCENCGVMYQVKLSKAAKAKYCSMECVAVAFSNRLPEENPNYRDGLSWVRKGERNVLMGRKKYRDWREHVLERDNYTCIECGIVDVIFHVDHIKPWVLYPELRYEVSNGRVLCKPCHYKTPTYGSKARLLGRLQ